MLVAALSQRWGWGPIPPGQRQDRVGFGGTLSRWRRAAHTWRNDTPQTPPATIGRAGVFPAWAPFTKHLLSRRGAAAMPSPVLLAARADQTAVRFSRCSGSRRSRQRGPRVRARPARCPAGVSAALITRLGKILLASLIRRRVPAAMIMSMNSAMIKDAEHAGAGPGHIGRAAVDHQWT